MHPVTRLLRIAFPIILLGLLACNPASHPVPSPLATALQPTPTAGLLSDTPTPAVMIASASTSTPDADATAVWLQKVALSTEIAAEYATAERVAQSVGTQFPNASTLERGGYINATLSAMGLIPTATPYVTATPTSLPFPAITEVGKYGNVGFRFAGSDEIHKIQRVYEDYWRLITFTEIGPTSSLPAELAKVMASYPVPTMGSDCNYQDVLQHIQDLQSQGLYLRLAGDTTIRWGQTETDAWLYADSPYNNIQSSVRSELLTTITAELVDLPTGQVIRSKSLWLNLEPWFEYDPANHLWVLVRDDGGPYCDSKYINLQAEGFFRR